MKPIYLFAFTFLLVSCSDQEDIPCTQFRQGNFYIKPSSTITGFSIERTDSMQVETNNRNGVKKNYSLTWINDCEYQLQLVDEEMGNEGSRLFNRGIFDSLNRIPGNTRIIATSKDYYVFEMKKKGIDLVYTDTAWVLK
jgi:hypothetical protein